MGDSGSKMRQFWLICCVVCFVAMQTFWLLMHHIWMFWMFNTIVAAVLIHEVINVSRHGMTVSTETTKAVKAGGKQRIYAYLASLFMCLSIFFLALHFNWI